MIEQRTITMRKLSRYKGVVVGSIVISVSFFALPYWVFGLDKVTPIFTAIGGLLFSIPIKYLWYIFKQPVLKIKEEVEERSIPIKQKTYGFIIEKTGNWTYSVNRIVVENIGRSAAKNCKGWIVIGESKERVCWTIPTERPNATINVKDEERLDFCAYYKKGPKTYEAITKGGIQKNVPQRFASDESTIQFDIGDPRIKSLDDQEQCEVLITSDNAEPVKAEVMFEKDKIRIVNG